MSLQHVRTLFDECVALPPGEREARLAACADPALRDEVRGLLAAHGEVEAAGSDPFAPNRLPPLPPPAAVGPYQVLERLGEGAMGEVWLAAQQKPVRRQVAIKIIKLGMDTREVIARFEMERQTLALMSHANVARMLDAGATETGRPYFVMEYVAGIPITRYCDDHWLDVPSRLELFVQVCAGVQHAHHRGIIHRDLKPSNVLVAEVDGEPVPKIIDFGIAKATTGANENSPHTRLGHLLGTPGYMSPEQAELSPLDVDTRTDVYSLGALLYELLTGRLPLDLDTNSVTPAALARALQTRDVERPSRRVLADGDAAIERAERRGRTPRRLAADLEGDLDWIVLKALARDRRHRYDSAAELCRDVERHLANEPVLAGPPSAIYRARKLVKRHRVIFASGTALVVASLAFGSAMMVQARETARERDRAELAAATSERVSALLIGLFRVSNPGESRGASVTARELLDDAAAKLPEELRDEPLVRARLQSAIGEVYLNLGLYAQAGRQFALARDALAPLVPPDDADRLAAERGAALALLGGEDLAGAEPALVRVYDAARARYGEGHRLVADTAHELARVRFYLGRHEQAIADFDAAFRARALVYGPDAEPTLRSLSGKAAAQGVMGRFAEAETTMKDVIARLTRSLGADAPSTLAARQNLAVLYKNAGRQRDALELHSAMLPAYRRVMGETHPDTLTVTGNYGTELREAGRHEEAYRLHADVVDKLRATLGPDALSTLGWELHLARDVADLGRPAEAEKQMSSIATRIAVRYGENHRDALEATRARAQVLYEMDRIDEARRVLVPLMDRLREHVGAESYSYRDSLLLLAEMDYRTRRPDDGRAWLTKAAAVEPIASGDVDGLPTLKAMQAAGRLPDGVSAATAATAGR